MLIISLIVIESFFSLFSDLLIFFIRRNVGIFDQFVVKTPVVRSQNIELIVTNGRACGGYLPVEARTADDDDDEWIQSNQVEIYV